MEVFPPPGRVVLPVELVLEVLKYAVSERSFKDKPTQLRLVCNVFNQVVTPKLFRDLQVSTSSLGLAQTHEKILDKDALGRVGRFCTALHINIVDKSSRPFWSWASWKYEKVLPDILTRLPHVATIRVSLTENDVLARILYERSFRVITDWIRLRGPAPLKELTMAEISPSVTNHPKARQLRFFPVEALSLELLDDDEYHAFRLNPLPILANIPIDLRLRRLSLQGKMSRYHVCDTETVQWPTGVTLSSPMRDPTHGHITHLHLDRITVRGSDLSQAIECLGLHLQEIFFVDVYFSFDGDFTHWVGEPNSRPNDQGLPFSVATMIREVALNLRVCRATELGYVVLPGSATRKLDTQDPCVSLPNGRTLAQRFVEVALGVKQPVDWDFNPIEYYSPSPSRNADKERSPLDWTKEKWDAAWYLERVREETPE
ncbi:hypothetical protein F5Y15DRAFT_429739 [Xylariaceae sp. FL0016]|nr:hypothetical protein F5Y15DRAFT_429739 [Xylariaceae sp. FL0016]